jgi:hypothetical protein
LRQKAFGIRPARLTDLKSREAHLRLGAIWAEFPLTADDRGSARLLRGSLLSASNDFHSAIVRGEANHFVERFGKLPHRVAKYLAGRVPMVPRLHMVSEVDELNRESVTNLVAPSVCEYSEDVEREKNIRYWSEEHK